MPFWVGSPHLLILLTFGLVCSITAHSNNGQSLVSEQNSSINDFVNILADNLLSWNENVQSVDEASSHRVRRSESRERPLHVDEYVTVDCTLACWIQTDVHSGAARRRLICRRKNVQQDASEERAGISAVVVKCTAHHSGQLVHMRISEEEEMHEEVADILSDGFALAIRSALLSILPIPETLYLTLEVPVVQIRYEDFRHLATWLRRLSLSLARTTSIDRSVLSMLSLESFKAEGCESAGLSVINQEDVHSCTVELLFICPERDYIALIADQTTRNKNCRRSMEAVEQQVNQRQRRAAPLSTEFTGDLRRPESAACSCENLHNRLDYLAAHSGSCVAQTRENVEDYKHLFFVSLWINVTLSTLLLVMLIFLSASVVQLRKSLYPLVTPGKCHVPPR